MKTILDILNASADYLQKKGISNSRRQAEDLLCDLFDFDRLKLYVEFERPLTEQELTLCRERLIRRSKGEPLAYIHGSTEFFGCKIKVSPAVLIPRQETEILVDKIANHLKNENLQNKVLWDICCGSGCIGIALKKKFPDLKVTLSDISVDALKIAKENAKINQVEVDLVQGNLLEPFQGNKAHFIVCNPPYISEEEYNKLEREVKEFEPTLALLGGKSGHEFYEYFAKNLSSFLHPEAKVWFEIGYDQGEIVKKLFHSKKVLLEKDFAGVDRFLWTEWT